MQPISEPFDTQSHRYSMFFSDCLRYSSCWRHTANDDLFVLTAPTCFEVLTPLVYFLKDFWNILRAYNVNWIYILFVLGAQDWGGGPLVSGRSLWEQLPQTNESTYYRKRKKKKIPQSSFHPYSVETRRRNRFSPAVRRPTSRCSPYVKIAYTKTCIKSSPPHYYSPLLELPTFLCPFTTGATLFNEGKCLNLYTTVA